MVISYKFPIYDIKGNIKCYTLIDKRDLGRMKASKWSLMGRGYIKGRIDKKNVYLHRFIMNETDPLIVIDHINRDPLDNTRKNLRRATRKENAFNRVKCKNKSSKFKGVCFDKNNGLWQSYYKIDQKKYLIGHYNNEKDAAKQYDIKAKQYFGKFANLNFK